MDTLLLLIDDKEKQIEVPLKFWELERKSVIQFIKKQWPKATWAGNGRGGDWAISINLK